MVHLDSSVEDHLDDLGILLDVEVEVELLDHFRTLYKLYIILFI